MWLVIIVFFLTKLFGFGGYPSLVCNATNVTEPDSSLEPLLLNTIPEDGNLVVKKGDYAQIGCEISGTPGTTISWHKDREPMVLFGNQRNITFKAENKSMDGFYECIVQSSAGPDSVGEIVVTVVDPPRINTIPRNGHLEVNIGDDVEIGCESADTPPPSILWRKNREFIHSLENHPRIKFKAADNNVSGVYECIAQNEDYDTTTAEITVVVSSDDTNSTTTPPPQLDDSYPIGMVHINGKEIANMTGLSFFYIPGEILKITCVPFANISVTGLKYNDEHICELFMENNCVPHFQTKQDTMYVKVENEKLYKTVRCEFLNNTSKYVQTIVLNLSPIKRKTSFEDSIGVSVNGLVLRPKKESTNYNFVYENYEGEGGEVVVDATDKAEMECSAHRLSKKIGYYSLYAKSHLTMSFKLPESRAHARVTCDITDGPSNYANVTVAFVQDSFVYETFIPNLSLSKILYRYKYNSTLTVIGYEYPEEGYVFNKTGNHYKVSYKKTQIKKMKIGNSSDLTRFSLRKNITSTMILFKHIPENSTTTHLTMLHFARKLVHTKPKEVINKKAIAVNNATENTPVKKLTHDEDMPTSMAYYQGHDVQLVTITVFAMLLLMCIIGMTVGMVAIIRRKRARDKKDDNNMVLNRPKRCGSTYSKNSEPLYDTIEENEYDDPEALPLGTGTVPRKGGICLKQMGVHVSQRPQLPLPPEASEDNRRYVHYDTPYENRIFRLGIPVVKFPDRFRSRQPKAPV